MSNAKKAFPGGNHHEQGMDLRDYFAAKAMQAIIGTASVPCFDGLGGLEDETAYAAYRVADAMLARRDKGGRP